MSISFANPSNTAQPSGASISDQLKESFNRQVSAWPSEALLGGQKTVAIAHNGSLYKLQATKLGKLILTK
jgi:hemin uptake protein HemP